MVFYGHFLMMKWSLYIIEQPLMHLDMYRYLLFLFPILLTLWNFKKIVKYFFLQLEIFVCHFLLVSFSFVIFLYFNILNMKPVFSAVLHQNWWCATISLRSFRRLHLLYSPLFCFMFFFISILFFTYLVLYSVIINNALKASKNQRKFSTCSSDCSYAVIVEAKRHAFVYWQPTIITSGPLVTVFLLFKNIQNKILINKKNSRVFVH